MLQIFCTSRFLRCIATYIIYLLTLWLLFVVVRFSSPPENKFDYGDSGTPSIFLCNVEARESQVGTNGAASVFFAKNGSSPSCLTDTSMFKMSLNSKLLKLHLDSPFWKNANCCYHNFWRLNDEPDYKIAQSSACYELTENVTKIPKYQDFLRIICKEKHTSDILYTDQLAHVRVQKTFKSHEDTSEWSELRKDKLSILILGMRSTSRLDFLWDFPKTHKFLVEDLKAYQFQGYNSIGQGQVQNIYPLLSGLPYKAFYKKCDPDEVFFLDSCPFKWDKIYKYGYHISFQEEHQGPPLFTIGSRYYRNGFQKSHFNYDFRLLNHKLEFLKLGHRRNGSEMNTDQCYGPRLSSKSSLENFAQTAHAFKARSVFHMTWTSSLPQDPGTNDKLLNEMLQELLDSESLNKTALIFLSDEGLGTESSRIIRNPHYRTLPFLYIVLPDWFKRKNPLAAKNMELNTNGLLTTVDVFQTLGYIMDATQLDDAHVQYKKNTISHNAPISLFLPIPRNRTCASAGISDLLCACLPRKILNIHSEPVRNATNILISTFNIQLRLFPNCAKLELQEIISAQELVKSNSENSFIITFKAKFADVIWEGTVRRANDLFSFEDIRFVSYGANVTLCVTHNEDYPTCICNRK